MRGRLSRTIGKPRPHSRASGGKSGAQAAGGGRAAQIVGSDKDPAKQRMGYFKRMMCQGEVSKAYRAITSDAKVLPYSLEGLDDLRKKQPAADPGAVPWMAGSDFELEGAKPLLVSFDSVIFLIRTSAKGIPSGHAPVPRPSHHGLLQPGLHIRSVS